MKFILSAITVFLAALFAPSGAEYCDFDNNIWNGHETWCSDGCCFDSCCDLDLDLDLGYTNYPAIIGGCVGGLFSLALIIALICACVKSGTRPGRVITVAAPVGVSTVAVANTSNGGVAGYGMYSSPPSTTTAAADYKLNLHS